MTNSAGQPKPRHPNSLANLRPPWQAGVKPANPHNTKGPLITPALRKFAEMPMAELRSLLDMATAGEVPASLTVAEGIALVALKKALTDEIWGDKARDTVIERLDGRAASVEVDVNVGIAINLKWDDGS